MSDINYQLAVRQSLINKLGVFLQQSGSRDMLIPLNFNSGTADFLFNSTTYGIVPREPGEELYYPGVNVIFLGEDDITTGRSTSSKKRYLLTTKIVVVKMIDSNIRPTVVSAEVLGVCKLILRALADGHVDIYTDLNTPNPVFTGSKAWYHDTGYSFKDESLAIPGGDIRLGCVLGLNYIDLSL